MTGDDLTHLAGELPPTDDDIINAASDYLGMITAAHNLPIDYDGCTITIIKSPENGQLKAVILSPVDMYGDEPFARYAVEPTAIKQTDAPKLVLVS